MYLYVFFTLFRPQVTRTNFALVAFMPKLLLAFKVKPSDLDKKKLFKSVKARTNINIVPGKVVLLTVDLVYLGIGWEPPFFFDI